ncbi:hypothetical protein DSECCO2_575830 [anaerobic digester metagenome]
MRKKERDHLSEERDENQRVNDETEDKSGYPEDDGGDNVPFPVPSGVALKVNACPNQSSHADRRIPIVKASWMMIATVAIVIVSGETGVILYAGI